MSLNLELRPEVEKTLRDEAAARGEAPEQFVSRLIERELSSKRKRIGEILAPVHDEFLKSRLTETELDSIIEQAREEVWRERQNR